MKPGLVAVPAWAARLARRDSARPTPQRGAGTGAFATACLVFNTRPGRELEEVVVERLTRALRVLAFEVSPGVFQDGDSGGLRARVLEWVEKLIYAVDEWLRGCARRGQSAGVLAGQGGARAGLGGAWRTRSGSASTC